MAIQVSIIDGMGRGTISGSTLTTTGANTNDFMGFPNDLLTGPGVVTLASDSLVTQHTPAGMSVDVSAGTCYVLNASWVNNSNTQTRFWRVINDATVQATITTANATNPRIDIVCVKVDTVTTPDDNASNVGSIIVVAGTPAVSPTAPATPSNYLKLAQVAVAAGATSIANANITDYRKGVTADVENGWNFANEIWAYASATTITVPTDATAKYQKGDKIRIKQGGAYKYFYIVAVTATLLTITGGIDYTLTNATITDNYYSKNNNAIGFPTVFAYVPTVTWSGGTTNPGTATNNVMSFSITGGYCIFSEWWYIGAVAAGGNRTDNLITLPVTFAVTNGSRCACASMQINNVTKSVPASRIADATGAIVQNISMTPGAGFELYISGSYPI